MDFARATRAAKNRKKVERNCCRVICGAPMTLQGYEIEFNRVELFFYDLTFIGKGQNKMAELGPLRV